MFSCPHSSLVAVTSNSTVFGGCTDCFSDFLPMVVRHVTEISLTEIREWNGWEKALLMVLRKHWTIKCHGWLIKLSGKCPLMKNLLEPKCDDLFEFDKCKCYLDNMYSVHRIHEICSVVLSLIYASRSPGSHTTQETDEVWQWDLNMNEIFSLLALEAHTLIVCWKILSVNIYEYCQNLIDWPVDTFLQISGVLSILTPCLKRSLQMRLNVETYADVLESKTLGLLEGLVEEVVAAGTDIKNSIVIAKENRILTGESEGKYTLYHYIRTFPFNLCKSEVVNALSSCYD